MEIEVRRSSVWTRTRDAFPLVAGIATVAVILIVATLLASGGRQSSIRPPVAQLGVLDLRDWDFSEHGVVQIDRGWNFSWRELFGPDETPSASIVVDGIWDEVTGADGESLGATGYGTYRLRVLLAEASDRPELALRVRGVMTAHRLWLGDVEVPGAGVVAADPDQVVAATPNRLHVVPTEGNVLDITLQVANAKFRMGGLRKSFQLGAVDDVLDLHTHQVLYDCVIFTLLFAAGGYFLLIYAVRKNEAYRLYFGLLCLLAAVRSTFAGEALLIDIVAPTLSWEAHITTEYAANFLGCILVPGMIGVLYREQAPTVWLRLTHVVSLGMMAFVILVPATTVVKTGPLFNALVANASLFMMVVLVRAIRAREEHAGLFLLTIALFALGMLLDILRSELLLASPVEISPALFTAVLLAQTMILARSFTRTFTANVMLTDELRLANEDLLQTNTAVQRFVPYEFLSLLQRSSIREVTRGDSTAMDIDVLFCDLRNFTTIAEGLPPQQTFAFINDWLASMEPVIHRHQGFVNQYLGDCIMALFIGGADRAVHAGIEMLGRIESFGTEQHYVEGASIRIGIGMSAGPVMLGTIGSQNRLDDGVVGDAVNVASRIEGMTKLFGTPMLISHHTRNRLSDPSSLRLRELDTVAVKGRSQPTTVYEVVDALPAADIAARAKTMDDFSGGLDAYRQGHFSEAVAFFSSCIAQDPNDGPAWLHLHRCKALTENVPDQWDGVSVLTVK